MLRSRGEACLALDRAQAEQGPRRRRPYMGSPVRNAVAAADGFPAVLVEVRGEWSAPDQQPRGAIAEHTPVAAPLVGVLLHERLVARDALCVDGRIVFPEGDRPDI